MVAQPVRTNEDDMNALRTLASILKRHAADDAGDARRVLLAEESGDSVVIPDAVLTLLSEAVDVLMNGDAVAVMPYETQLTTQEAANYIGVSRPYLVSLLEAGEIPFIRLQSHRRILLGDLEAYRRRRMTKRLEALDDLTREMYEAGLYTMTGVQQPDE